MGEHPTGVGVIGGLLPEYKPKEDAGVGGGGVGVPGGAFCGGVGSRAGDVRGELGGLLLGLIIHQSSDWDLLARSWFGAIVWRIIGKATRINTAGIG